ncbi:radical SAM protein [Listeria welshimeri]|nr:radical SAM protein [Listeria welshimeri]
MDLNKLTNNNKILYHILGNNKVLNIDPISVEIHLTNDCNANCGFCSYKMRKRKKEQISSDKLQELLKSLVKLQVKSVYLSGGGEPTLHPDIEYVIKFLHKKNIKVALITNGMNEEIIKRAASYCEYILINIPDHKKMECKKMMGIENIDKIKLLPRELENKCLLGARIVLTDKNTSSFEESAKEISSWGFDYVQCTPAVDYEKQEYLLSDKILKNISKGLIFNNKDVSLMYKESNDSEINDCFSINNRLHTTINALGEVYLCPTLVSINRDLSIGNINEVKLEELWNSKNHKEIIDFININCVPAKCSFCRFNGYNKLIQNLIKQENPHKDFL